jgi:hypothetical protein
VGLGGRACGQRRAGGNGPGRVGEPGLARAPSGGLGRAAAGLRPGNFVIREGRAGVGHRSGRRGIQRGGLAKLIGLRGPSPRAPVARPPRVLCLPPSSRPKHLRPCLPAPQLFVFSHALPRSPPSPCPPLPCPRFVFPSVSPSVLASHPSPLCDFSQLLSELVAGVLSRNQDRTAT